MIDIIYIISLIGVIPLGILLMKRLIGEQYFLKNYGVSKEYFNYSIEVLREERNEWVFEEIKKC